MANVAIFHVYSLPLQSGLHSCILNTKDFRITEDGIPSGCVPTKGEDVRVVSRDHGERVGFSGQLCGSTNGLVEHHSFSQRQFGNAIVVAVIDSAS